MWDTESDRYAGFKKIFILFFWPKTFGCQRLCDVWKHYSSCWLLSPPLQLFQIWVFRIIRLEVFNERPWHVPIWLRLWRSRNRSEWFLREPVRQPQGSISQPRKQLRPHPRTGSKPCSKSRASKCFQPHRPLHSLLQLWAPLSSLEWVELHGWAWDGGCRIQQAPFPLFPSPRSRLRWLRRLWRLRRLRRLWGLWWLWRLRRLRWLRRLWLWHDGDVGHGNGTVWEYAVRNGEATKQRQDGYSALAHECAHGKLLLLFFFLSRLLFACLGG